MATVYFNPSVGGDGSTVTDDSDPSTGLGAGGHRTKFVPCLSNTVTVASFIVTKAGEAAVSASTANTKASSATASAATATTKAGEASTSASNAAASAASAAGAVTAHASSGDHDSRYYTKTLADSATSSAIATHASGSGHDGRYYTKTLSDARYPALAHDHDSRYYTETELGTKFYLNTATNGRQEFLGGGMLQFGRVAGAPIINITFSTPFPNAVLSITGTKEGTAGHWAPDNGFAIYNVTNTGFSVGYNDGSTGKFNWMAFGY